MKMKLLSFFGRNRGKFSINEHQTTNETLIRTRSNPQKNSIWSESRVLEKKKTDLDQIQKYDDDDDDDRENTMKQIGILYAYEDKEIGRKLKKSLTNWSHNIQIITSEDIIPGSSFHPFYDDLLRTTSHLIVVLSRNLIHSPLFTLLKWEVAKTDRIEYYIVDDFYKNDDAWNWITQDIVTQKNFTDIQDWGRKIITHMDCHKMIYNRVKRVKRVKKDFKAIAQMTLAFE